MNHWSLKTRSALTTAYAAGLRASEAADLKIANIDSDRLVIRVEHGKGGRDRCVMLSVGAVARPAPVTRVSQGPAPHGRLVPPPLPRQTQVQGPLPETTDAVPALHSPVVGALAVVTPFAVPQAPLTAPEEVPQAADAPPPLPAQVQVQGPAPETSDAVPDRHRPPTGAPAAATPLALPQIPELAASGALQAAKPQRQLQGPFPLTGEAAPMLQRPPAGAALAGTPFAGPHRPATGWAGAVVCAAAGRASRAARSGGTSPRSGTVRSRITCLPTVQGRGTSVGRRSMIRRTPLEFAPGTASPPSDRRLAAV